MEEQLISFETAKLAKEKGFSEKCPYYCYYNNNTKDIVVQRTDGRGRKNFNKWFDTDRLKTASLPTQSLLQKWLREIHRKYVQPTVGFHETGFRVGKIPTGFIHTDGKEHIISYHPSPKGKFKTYEEALEAGLIYTLEMIK